MKTKIKFDDYVKMIQSRAHYYSRCYRIAYEDVEAQGFLIYCISLQDYEKKKASFSTFLYRNLSGRLRDYCRIKNGKEKFDCSLDKLTICEKRSFDNRTNDDVHFDLFSARENGPSMEQFLLYAECYLSPLAFKILKWLLNDGLSDFKSKTNPSLNVMSKVLSINLDTLKGIWQELSDFWNMRGAVFYASN